MLSPAGAVCISLGSVVLDRPDHSGHYIAKDLAGGWAYLVTDAQGDHRYRGQGVCEGGLDMALRCAFLSASHRVTDSGRLGIVVESRQAHRTMARLAVADPTVVAAIAGRPVAIMTRPQERSSFHVRSAAERAAAVALHERERAERQQSGALAVLPPEAGATEAPDVETPAAADAVPALTTTWRSRRGPEATPPAATAPDIAEPAPPPPTPLAASQPPPAPPPLAAMVRVVRQRLGEARQSLTTAGLAAARPAPPPRNRAIVAWLSEFDNHMASVKADLRDVGA